MSTNPSTTESSGIHEISGVLVRVVRVLMLTSRTRLMSTFTRELKYSHYNIWNSEQDGENSDARFCRY